MSTDPVCGMEVYELTAPSTVHRGITYYFCSRACLGAFQDHPGSYAGEVAHDQLEKAA